MGCRSFDDNDIVLLANLAFKTYEFVDRFISYKSEMAYLPNIAIQLNNLMNKLHQRNRLQDVKKLFIPCLLFLQINNEDTKGLFKTFIDWKQKTMASGGNISRNLNLVDLLESACTLSDVVKSNIIKAEISFYRRYPKYNGTRRMLIDKLRQLKVSIEQTNCNIFIADIETLWMDYFDNVINKSKVDEYESLLKDMKANNTRETAMLIPIVLLWIFLTKKKVLEQTIEEHINENSKLKQKEIVVESSHNPEDNRPCISHIVSLKKDQEMLRYLQEAYEYFDTLYLRKDALVDSDPYVTKKLILDSLNVAAEAFHLMKHYKLHEKTLQLLVKYSEKFDCIETKIKALCDLSCNYRSTVILDRIKEAEKSDKR